MRLFAVKTANFTRCLYIEQIFFIGKVSFPPATSPIFLPVAFHILTIRGLNPDAYDPRSSASCLTKRNNPSPEANTFPAVMVAARCRDY
jgi:hypothetical protein